jgi:hypothetical protein
MGSKVRSLAAVTAIVCGGACARIAGLAEYSAGALSPDSDSSANSGTEPSAEEAGESAGEDGPSEHDAGAMGVPGPVPGEGEDADDLDGGDAGPPIDAGDPSQIPDGYACGPGTCGGCCSATGDCVGGQSVATCGVAGQKCKDCTDPGACSQGSCATPAPDAGPPPMCVVASCSTRNCAGFPIQGVCCKSDQTCGCQWTIFAPCL